MSKKLPLNIQIPKEDSVRAIKRVCYKRKINKEQEKAMLAMQ